MSGGRYIVCAYWGEQLIPSMRVKCVLCPAELATDLNNMIMRERFQLQPICPECFLKSEDQEFAGFACAGAKIDIEGARRVPQAFIEMARQMVKRRKAGFN
jgi:hypothetical protein